MKKHLVLIDGHHLMYRAFYAIPVGLKTKNGELTNAVYGVASMLISILKTEEPDYLLFCFDAGEDTFRHQENATYKDGRAETPDEFYAQIPRILEMIDTLGIKHVAEAKYEADDFLCAYAKAGEEAGMRVTIVTGDRDALQLATENVRVAIPHKAYQAVEYLGPAEILAKYGVTPAQVPSYKGLTGDASDNLPGVKGIGPKGAAQLIQSYGSIAGIYEHLDEIKETTKAKLIADRDQAFFCERMAQLVCDMPLPVALQETELKDMPVDPVLSFFKEMEFHTLSKRFHSMAGSPYGTQHFQPVTQVVEVAKKVDAENQLSLF
jgi:DNA polymerase I